MPNAFPTRGGALDTRGGAIAMDTGPSLTIIDSFESQSLSAYTGDTADFSFVTANATNGQYALRPDNTGNTEAIFSESGLPAYPGVGDTYRADVYWESGTDYRIGVYFRAYNGDGWRLRFETSNDSLVVQDRQNNTIVGDNTAGLQDETLYCAEVEQRAADDWSVRVYEGGINGPAIFDESFTDDRDADQTGIGFNETAATGGVYFDYARMVA